MSDHFTRDCDLEMHDPGQKGFRDDDRVCGTVRATVRVEIVFFEENVRYEFLNDDNMMAALIEDRLGKVCDDVNVLKVEESDAYDIEEAD